MTTYPVKLLKDKDGTAFIPVVNSGSIITPEGDTLDDLLDEKQDTLISGTNLKTINNQSLLGEGNITIQGGGSATDVQINGTSITSSNTANIITKGTYNSSSNKIATENDLPTKVSDLQNDSGFTTNTGTITGISVNNTSIATSGVANITSVPASILTGTIPSGITATTQSSGDNSTKLATTAYVDGAISALPEPMIFKGSLGTGGTITSLPTAAATNEGYTYKVITAGTYASQTAKIGDTFISDGNTWILIPSGDEPSGTVTSVTLQASSPIAIDNNTAITTSGARTISHANSGVTAGTYRSVTVNATGHVTEGTNPTTISGYGITDAKIASGTITLGSNTITPLTASSTLDATKLSGTIPSSCYTDTNNAVTQTATTTSNAYELLFSSTADNTTRTEGARKTSTLTYNPSTKALSTGGTVNGYTLGAACAKAVVTSVDTSANLPTSNAVKTFVEGKGYTSNTGTITKVQANSTDVASSGTANIPAASTSAYGVTKLSDATNSTSTALAATANAVKTAYDLADGKLEKNYTQTQANGEIKWQGGEDSSFSELIARVTSNTDNWFSQIEMFSDNMLLTSGFDSAAGVDSSISMTPYAIDITNYITDGSITISADSITLDGEATVTSVPDTNYSIVNKEYVDDAVAAKTDTKNTAGSTDTSSKIFLIGATSQAANPQTYSDNEVYATSGVLTTKSVQVGGTAATMQYNSTDKCIEFIFA